MVKEYIINLEKEYITGNILDIGGKNYGIIYNLYKHSNKEIALDCINGKEESRGIKQNDYDAAVMFFYLSSLKNNYYRKKLIKEILNYIKMEGEILIWDIDKPRGRILNSQVKVMLPEEKVKNIKIRDFNLLKCYNKAHLLNILKEHFEILDLRDIKECYFIRAKRKGSKVNESITCSN